MPFKQHQGFTALIESMEGGEAIRLMAIVNNAVGGDKDSVKRVFDEQALKASYVYPPVPGSDGDPRQSRKKAMMLFKRRALQMEMSLKRR